MRTHHNDRRKTTMKANTRIKKAQRQNERDVLAHIQRHGQVCHIGLSVPWLNAIRRLEEAGRIRHDSYRLGWVLAGERGAAVRGETRASSPRRRGAAPTSA